MLLFDITQPPFAYKIARQDSLLLHKLRTVTGGNPIPPTCHQGFFYGCLLLQLVEGTLLLRRSFPFEQAIGVTPGKTCVINPIQLW